MNGKNRFVVHVVGRQYEIEDHVGRVIEGK